MGGRGEKGQGGRKGQLDFSLRGGEDARTFVVGTADDQADEEVARESEHHCEKGESAQAEKVVLSSRRLTRVPAPDPVDKPCADKDAGKGDRAEEELPFCGVAEERLALGVDDGGNDGAGEDAIGERDEV